MTITDCRHETDIHAYVKPPVRCFYWHHAFNRYVIEFMDGCLEVMDF